MARHRAPHACLEEVRVQNLALLERVELDLATGLNVVSGETGEGKSLLMLAIQLLLGARARKGLVRSGCAEAIIEGRFRIPAGELAELTDLVAADAEEVCLRRVVFDNGQSRAYLDGSLCPVGLLQRMGARLVDLHGQHLSLLRPADQRAVLDRFADSDDLVGRWRELHGELTEIRARQERLEEDHAGRAERMEFVRFQIRELDEASVAPGEEESLVSRLRILTAGARLQDLLRDAADLLQEGDTAVGTACSRFSRGLRETGAADDGQFGTLAERLEALSVEADDLGRECASELAQLDLDPEEAEQLDQRLTDLRHLARRHRTEVSSLPDRLDELRAEEASLSGDGDPSVELDQRAMELVDALRSVGRDLHEARCAGAKRLEKAMRPALAELRMEKAQVRVAVEPDPWPEDLDPLAAGADGPGPVSFLVAANPGEPEQPLERIASGGETARLLLALKGALAGAHRIPLLIFDEIDAGIGGRVGVPFGRRIRKIARHHQVLVVTHLPQVAAFADKHFMVSKSVRAGRTRTQVKTLAGRDRESELAAMLGGSAGGADAPAMEQARALLEDAAS